MTVGIGSAWQFIPIASINNALYIITTPLYALHSLIIHLADIFSPLFSILTGHMSSHRIPSMIVMIISIKLKTSRLSFLLAVLRRKPLVKFFIVVIK